MSQILGKLLILISRALPLVQILQCRTKNVCAKLEVKEVNMPGNYLGLPMCVGKYKNKAFSFLMDRVGQKLQGWSNVSLQKGGKLVLLKTATQAIPNFWMSMFLIPANVCDAIE